jgi:uncharacterized Fe-S cluster-containing MiaB family protein
MDMNRYSEVTNKNIREIVLLKGEPCKWGRCNFCDYIEDNCENEKEAAELNNKILDKVTGKYGALEVINSGSVFELPKESLNKIRAIVEEKNIKRLLFECHWIYRKRLQEIEDLFNIPIIFKCGVETFDDNFRNNILNKGMIIKSPEEVAEYFKSICLMVGIRGQTKGMIDRDIYNLIRYFEYGCINIYVENTTAFKRDEQLIEWFRNKYAYLDKEPNIEILWNNTDFGVGD